MEPMVRVVIEEPLLSNQVCLNCKLRYEIHRAPRHYSTLVKLTILTENGSAARQNHHVICVASFCSSASTGLRRPRSQT